MDSIKDILLNIQKKNTTSEQSTEEEQQPKLFDTDSLATNPKKLFGDKHKYISKEYQLYGLRLSRKLQDEKRATMYIKWAKTKPRAILETAYSFTSDYPNAKNKARIFMWKVKDLENAHKTNQENKKDTK